MTRPFTLLFSLILLWSVTAGYAAEPFFGARNGESYEGKVIVIKVGQEDLVNKAAFRYFQRQLQRANQEKARALVLELDTPGGYAFETIKLIVKDLQKLEVPSFAFVNPEATSAGAITAFGCDKIYMAPVSTIGSAAVVAGGGMEIEGTMKEKIESFMDASVTAVAEANGHNPEVARAMMFMDESYEFGDIVSVGEGELLNLTAKQAAMEYQGKPLLAAGLVSSVEELLAAEGIEAEIIKAEPTGFERFSFWVAKWSALLILGGLLFAYVESQAPGFGIGGSLSLLCFGLFFFGNNMAGNLAGYEHIALFVLGIILIVVELFILPGFIVPGVLGVILVLGSLVAAMGAPENVDQISNEGVSLDAIIALVKWPLINLGLGLFGGTVAIFLAMKYLPDLPIFRSFSIRSSLPRGTAGAVEGELVTPAGGRELIGLTGKAISALRPSGKAEIEGVKHQVTLESGYADSGTDVRVVAQDGFRILVEKL